MLLTLAWRNLWRNKRRTLITVAAVAFAVLLAIFMRSLQEGVYQNMIDQVVGGFSGYIQVHKKGYWEDRSLDNSFEYVAQDLPDGLLASPRIESFALASSGPISKVAAVIGIDPEAERHFSRLEAKLSEGRYLTRDEEAVLIAQGLADKLQLGLQDTLILLGQGFRSMSAAGKYPIAGVVNMGSPRLENIVYLPLPEAQYFYAAENRVTALAVNPPQPRKLQAAVSRLNEHFDTTRHEVMAWPKMMPEIEQTIKSDRAGGIIFMGVLYMIIAFGMFSTVLMMTKERSYEFGVLTAIGMKKHKLALVMVWETLFISLLGLLAGAFISLPLVVWFHHHPINLGPEMQKAYAEFGLTPISLRPSCPLSFTTKRLSS